MKVLWLAPFPYIDDANAHPAPWIVSLARLLVENGVELTILNYNSKIKEKVVKKKFDGIQLIYIKTPPLKIDIIFFYRIRINIMKNYLNTIIDNFDILHIHGTEHQYQVMAKDLKIPTLISIQGIISEVIKVLPLFSNIKMFLEWKLSSLYEKKYLKNYKYFSCRTHWDTNLIESMNPNARIFNIWEVIREEFFENHFSNDRKNILFVGGKSPIKGLDKLLKSYNDVLQSKGFKLIILGNCKIADINSIIKKNHLTSINIKNIDCRGIQNVNGMIKAFDDSFCLIHPTLIDNSPNSVCEAQIAGLPVIASDIGGVSSLIEDEETGLLIGEGFQEIGDAVEKLLNNDSLREKISNRSRDVARNRHNKIFILKETINIYNILLKEHL